MGRAVCLFFFKQNTAYEMRISDWSSDVCSSDLGRALALAAQGGLELYREVIDLLATLPRLDVPRLHRLAEQWRQGRDPEAFRTGMELLIWWLGRCIRAASPGRPAPAVVPRSEERRVWKERVCTFRSR